MTVTLDARPRPMTREGSTRILLCDYWTSQPIRDATDDEVAVSRLQPGNTREIVVVEVRQRDARAAAIRRLPSRGGRFEGSPRREDLNGTWASHCFSSFNFGFAGSRFVKLRDRDAGLMALRAYNDWMIEEWCAADPARYIPMQMPWLGDPEVAATEIRVNAARGFRAVSFPENPAASACRPSTRTGGSPSCAPSRRPRSWV